jgi:23S rRNA pseudouridine955/2504/2580 synthase
MGNGGAAEARAECIVPYSLCASGRLPEPLVALLTVETGRTHQIRVHLTHLGFPLAGDDKYGDFAWNRMLVKQGLKRMFLHARRIGFVHPITGVDMVVESPLPPDLGSFVARLDRPQPVVDHA